MNQPKFNFKFPDPKLEKWGFLRESSKSKDVGLIDKVTGLHRTGLDKYLKVIFPNYTFTHDQTIPNSKKNFRPDYRCDELKLIVEFDGVQHYTQPEIIQKDKIKDAFYRNLGFKVVRIPFFIQLTNKAVKTMFGIEVKESLFNGNFPSLCYGISSAFLCPAGVMRMAQDFAKYPEQYDVNVRFLDSWEVKDDCVNGVRLLKETYQKINGRQFKGNPVLFIKEAEEFLKIAGEQDKLAQKLSCDGLGTIHSGPRNACLSFACELYLKALIQIQKGFFPGVHDLKRLYKSLSDTSKKNIEKSYGEMPNKSVEDLLDRTKDAFVEWRYIYVERNGDVIFDISGMFRFAKLLKKEANDELKTSS